MQQGTYQVDRFALSTGDLLQFVPPSLAEKEGHEAAVTARLRAAQNLEQGSPATFPVRAPSSADAQIWQFDEKTTMSVESSAPIVAAEDEQEVGTPISPDMCRLRRPFVQVPSVAVPIAPGPATLMDKVYTGRAASLGWTVHIHPDGTLYLHHSQERTVVEYLTNEQEFDTYIAIVMVKMLRLKEALYHTYPDYSEQHQELRDSELFLRVVSTSEPPSYYFSNWNLRTVFWLQPHTLERPFSSVSQLQYMLQFQFWEHVERFPAHRTLPDGAWDQLKSLLTFQVIDASTNSLSTAPYGPNDATLFLRALEGRKAESDYIDEALNASVARLWGEQCKVRSHHLHGAAQVRTERTERRGMNDQEPPCRSFQLVGLLLLFNEPHSFYRSLMEVFVDEVMYERFWKALYHDTLREEWKDHAFMATVSLAANMAFLTVGNVGGNGQSGYNALSPTSQMLSLCSTMLSIGSIVIGKSLPNFHRRLQRCTAIEATDYMTSFSKRQRNGLYKLAMLFSLPFALFMWSLALFVAALLSFAFERWMWTTGMPVVLVSAGILGVLMFSLLFLRTEGAHLFILEDHSATDQIPQEGRSIRQRCEGVVGELFLRMAHLRAGPGIERAASPRSEMTFVNEGNLPQDHRLDNLLSPTDGRRLSAEQMV